MIDILIGMGNCALKNDEVKLRRRAKITRALFTHGQIHEMRCNRLCKLAKLIIVHASASAPIYSAFIPLINSAASKITFINIRNILHLNLIPQLA